MSARVWRCHDSSSEHIQEHNYSTEFPLYSFQHPITFSPGTVAVVARILWVGLSCQSNASLLAPSFSSAGTIHQQLDKHQKQEQQLTMKASLRLFHQHHKCVLRLHEYVGFPCFNNTTSARTTHPCWYCLTGLSHHQQQQWQQHHAHV